MRTNREEFLSALIAVSPGLAAREFIEQSTCYVFSDGVVQTFNDEIACTHKCNIGVTGAVSAAPLQTLLAKMAEDELDISADDGELLVKGKRREAGIRMDAEVTLPLDSVDQPKKWKPIHEDFCEAVKLIHACAAKRDSDFVLTCVHIHPDYIEACDNIQAARWPMETGVKESILIKRDTIRTIVDLEITEISKTKSWLHFRNAAGLMLSCRLHTDDYPPIDELLIERGSGESFVFPGGLSEMLDKAEVFSGESDSNNRVEVHLKSNRMMVRGEGVNGWYKEMKKVVYDGPSMKFLIGPQYLVELAKMENTCEIVDGRLALDTGRFQYITCTGDLSSAPTKNEKTEKREVAQTSNVSDDDVPF